MKKSIASNEHLSVASHLRGEIEKAEESGVSREDMTLHLTLGDVSKLTRDRNLPVTDISFAGGTMKFLGVTIVKGGVSVTALRHPGTTEGR